MAKLYFKFGAMGSSKTAQALMTKFNYEEKDKTVWLIKPAIDTRDDRVENGRRITEAKSRIGLAAPPTPLRRTTTSSSCSRRARGAFPRTSSSATNASSSRESRWSN